MSLRLVHSFVSRNCDDKNLFIHLSYFILSCIYAKKAGFEIALHCDNRTMDILKIAPYDEIINDLENVPSPANKTIYAWSKFKAMENEPLGTIHIDGDVFLKSEGLKDILNFNEYDCIVQSIEHYNTFNNNSKHLFLKNIWEKNTALFMQCKYPVWANRKCESMFNCGVVVFNNQELKNEYFNTYWKMLDLYNKTGLMVYNTTPDIIIEQQFLKDLVEHNKYKVKFVLPYCDSFDELCNNANHINYQHVIGGSKKENIEKVLLLIKKHDEHVYNELMNIRKKLYDI